MFRIVVLLVQSLVDHYRMPKGFPEFHVTGCLEAAEFRDRNKLHRNCYNHIMSYLAIMLSLMGSLSTKRQADI